MFIVGLCGCSINSKTTIGDIGESNRSELILLDVKSEKTDGLVFCEIGANNNWSCPVVTKKTIAAKEEPPVIIEQAPRAENKKLDNILFDFNESYLTNVARLKLISYMPIFANSSIILNGYTDDVGGDEYNKNLSMSRAESVKKFLIEYGVPSSKISINGLGECCFIKPNTNDESRSINRRVEIYIRE